MHYHTFLDGLFTEADMRKAGVVTASDIAAAVQRRHLLSGARRSPTSTGRARGASMRAGAASSRGGGGGGGGGGGVNAYTMDVDVSIAALLALGKKDARGETATTIDRADWLRVLQTPADLERSEIATLVTWIRASFVTFLRETRFLTKDEASVMAAVAMSGHRALRSSSQKWSKDALAAVVVAAVAAGSSAAAAAAGGADEPPSTAAAAEAAAALSEPSTAMASASSAPAAAPPSVATRSTAAIEDEWDEGGPQRSRAGVPLTMSLSSSTSARRGTYFGSFPANGSGKRSALPAQHASSATALGSTPPQQSQRSSKVTTARGARAALARAEEAAGLPRSSRVPGVPRNRPTTRNLWLRHFDLALLEFKEASNPEERARALASIKELKAMGIPRDPDAEEKGGGQGDEGMTLSGRKGGGRSRSRRTRSPRAKSEKMPLAVDAGELTNLYGIKDLADLRSLATSSSSGGGGTTERRASTPYLSLGRSYGGLSSRRSSRKHTGGTSLAGVPARPSRATRVSSSPSSSKNNNSSSSSATKRTSPPRGKDAWWLGAAAGVPAPRSPSLGSKQPMTLKEINAAKSALIQRSVEAQRAGKPWAAMKLAAESVGIKHPSPSTPAAAPSASAPSVAAMSSTSGVPAPVAVTAVPGASPAEAVAEAKGDGEAANAGEEEDDDDKGGEPIATCVALFGYNSADWKPKRGHLSFAAGDEIALLRTDDTGWWFGTVLTSEARSAMAGEGRKARQARREELANRGGLFPANHVTTREEHNHRNDPLLLLLTSCRLAQYYDAMRSTLGVDSIDDLELVDAEHLDMIEMKPMHQRRFFQFVRTVGNRGAGAASSASLASTVAAANAASVAASGARQTNASFALEDANDAALTLDRATTLARFAGSPARGGIAASPARAAMLPAMGGSGNWANELALQRGGLAPPATTAAAAAPSSPAATPGALALAASASSPSPDPMRTAFKAGDFVMLRNARAVAGSYTSNNPRYWVGRVVSVGAAYRCRLHWFAERPFQSGIYAEVPKTFVEKSELLEPIKGMQFVPAKRAWSCTPRPVMEGDAPIALPLHVTSNALLRTTAVELSGSFDVAPADIVVDGMDGEATTHRLEITVQLVREALRTALELEAGASLNFRKFEVHNTFERRVAKARDVVAGRTTVAFAIAVRPLGSGRRHALLRSSGDLSRVTVENMCAILSATLAQTSMAMHFKSRGIAIISAESVVCTQAELNVRPVHAAQPPPTPDAMARATLAAQAGDASTAADESDAGLFTDGSFVRAPNHRFRPRFESTMMPKEFVGRVVRTADNGSAVMLQWFCESSLGSGMYAQRGDRWIEKPALLRAMPSMQFDTERKCWVDVTVKPNKAGLVAFALEERMAQQQGRRGGSVHMTSAAVLAAQTIHCSLTAAVGVGAASVGLKLAPGAVEAGGMILEKRTLVVNRGGATEEGAVIASVSIAASGAITVMLQSELTFSHAIGEPALQLAPSEAAMYRSPPSVANPLVGVPTRMDSATGTAVITGVAPQGPPPPLLEAATASSRGRSQQRQMNMGRAASLRFMPMPASGGIAPLGEHAEENEEEAGGVPLPDGPPPLPPSSLPPIEEDNAAFSAAPPTLPPPPTTRPPTMATGMGAPSSGAVPLPDDPPPIPSGAPPPLPMGPPPDDAVPILPDGPPPPPMPPLGGMPAFRSMPPLPAMPTPPPTAPPPMAPPPPAMPAPPPLAPPPPTMQALGMPTPPPMPPPPM